MSLKLKEIQDKFAAAILAGDQSIDHKGLYAVINGGNLKPSQRLQIHQNNFRLSLEDTLMDRFPKVETFVGTDFLRAVVRAFIEVTAPSDARLSEYGTGFPAFWRGFEHTQDYLYLADLLELEMSVDTVQELKHTPSCDRQTMEKALEMGDLSCLKLVPQFKIVHSDYPLFSLWLVGNGQLPPEAVHLDKGAETVLVLGVSGDVQMAALSVDETAVLEAFSVGHDLKNAILGDILGDICIDRIDEILLTAAERGMIQRVADENGDH